MIVKFSVKTPKSFFHWKSKQHIMKNIYLSNIRGILKTCVKFHLIMMNMKDVKPISKTCIFFIQYVTLVTASNNELFFTIIIMHSQMKLFFYQILSIMMF